MKILCVADTESRELWDFWSTAGRRLTEGVSLILSAGDLKHDYLEFLVTMLCVPCLYVRGNHDTGYKNDPPEGCICIEDRAVRITEDPLTGDAILTDGDSSFRMRGSAGRETGRIITVAGLGGSMRYHDGPDMYTEKEMRRRVKRLARRMKLGSVLCRTGEAKDGETADVRILLTHAPSFGHGDLDDLPHRGFECFNDLIGTWQPDLHLYGHVHMEYGNFERVTHHPDGTELINVSGMYILEV